MLKLSGGKDSNYGKSVKKLIEEKQLDRRVYLRGSTRDTADVYAKSDIFATTSTLESWEIALTEAMAAGLPCVGLKYCSGINELILDGGNWISYLTKCRGLFDCFAKIDGKC